MTLAQWAPTFVTIAGLAVFFGAAITRLKHTEERVKEIPKEAKDAAEALDATAKIEHLYECHPRAHKRATGHAEVIQ